MQQHPDYKYRPRRKPKPLVKSPNSNGHSNGSHHNGNSANNTSSHHHHHSNSNGSSNNNNNDSRSSNNNLHHISNHHHSLKSTSPSIISSHLHPHHPTSKYSFIPTIELPISFPPSQHSQQQAVFPSSIHYPLVDPTLALDLQARLHAMYMNAYYSHPWRLPLISSTTSSSSSPPLPTSTNHYASSPKISPTTTNSPPLEPDTQSTII